MEESTSPLSTSLIIPPIPPVRLDEASSFDMVDMEQSKLVWTKSGTLILMLSVEELQSSLAVDPMLIQPWVCSIASEFTSLSFSHDEFEHKLLLIFVLEEGAEVDVNSSRTRIFSPLISVICVTIESGSPRTLNASSNMGEVGETLRVGVAHLLFGGVNVSWPFKGDEVAMTPKPCGDGDRLSVALATSSMRSACSRSRVSNDTNKSASSQFSVTTSVQLMTTKYLELIAILDDKVPSF